MIYFSDLDSNIKYIIGDECSHGRKIIFTNWRLLPTSIVYRHTGMYFSNFITP